LPPPLQSAGTVPLVDEVEGETADQFFHRVAEHPGHPLVYVLDVTPSVQNADPLGGGLHQAVKAPLALEQGPTCFLTLPLVPGPHERIADLRLRHRARGFVLDQVVLSSGAERVQVEPLIRSAGQHHDRNLRSDGDHPPYGVQPGGIGEGEIEQYHIRTLTAPQTCLGFSQRGYVHERI
jgi:hypothetical protein